MSGLVVYKWRLVKPVKHDLVSPRSSVFTPVSPISKPDSGIPDKTLGHEKPELRQTLSYLIIEI